MGLSNKKRIETNKFKVFLVTICENIPQICVQLAFSILTSTFEDATAIALTSSVASIILVVGTCILQSGDKFNDKLFEFEVKFLSGKDKSKSVQYRYKLRNRIASKIAANCGFDKTTISMEQVVPFGMSGCRMKLSILSDVPAETLLARFNEFKDNGSLALAVKEALRLRAVPQINYLRIASENELEDEEWHAERADELAATLSLDGLQQINDGDNNDIENNNNNNHTVATNAIYVAGKYGQPVNTSQNNQLNRLHMKGNQESGDYEGVLNENEGELHPGTEAHGMAGEIEMTPGGGRGGSGGGSGPGAAYFMKPNIMKGNHEAVMSVSSGLGSSEIASSGDALMNNSSNNSGNNNNNNNHLGNVVPPPPDSPHPDDEAKLKYQISISATPGANDDENPETPGEGVGMIVNGLGNDNYKE